MTLRLPLSSLRRARHEEILCPDDAPWCPPLRCSIPETVLDRGYALPSHSRCDPRLPDRASLPPGGSQRSPPLTVAGRRRRRGQSCVRRRRSCVMPATTSRHHGVTTSRHHGVTTSRRHDVTPSRPPAQVQAQVTLESTPSRRARRFSASSARRSASRRSPGDAWRSHDAWRSRS